MIDFFLVKSSFSRKAALFVIDEQKMLHSSTNSSTQTRQSSIHPLPAQRLKRLVATGHELSWRLQFQTCARERLGNVKRDTLSTRSERPQGPLTDLERSEFYLREGERLAHMGSWSLKSDGIFDYWSPETFVLFGFDPSEGIPTLPKWLTVLHPDDRDLLAKTLERIFRESVRVDVTYRVDHPKQGKRIMHSTGEPVVEDGKVTRLIGNTLDITEQENAIRELKKAFGEIRALKDELYKENIVLREEINSTSMFEEVLGTSAVLQRVLALAAKVAPTDSTVLIMGETGTGKELIARATHKRSKRAERSFVSVNCAAIPSSLIMSELFGHEKGAFTGAVQRRLGRFELADGGTLFLDEVGDLPLETQIALLRVLQEREFERVGGTEMLRCDVRVIAATNRDLHSAIAAGSFRSDLFYRLNVFPITLPPLRERKEDVALLVNYFVDRYAKRAGKKIDTIQKKSLEALQEYSWPGNVRELQNVIERSLIIVDTNEFSVDKNWFSKKPHSVRSSQPASRTSSERNASKLLLRKQRENLRSTWRRGQAGHATFNSRIQNSLSKN